MKNTYEDMKNLSTGRWLSAILILFFTLQTQAGNTVTDYRTLWAQAEKTYRNAQGEYNYEILTEANQLSSNASDAQEGKNLGDLIDGNPNTFWHSDWHSQVKDTHYLQVKLKEAVNGYLVIDVTRRITDNDHVTLLGVRGSNNGTDWTHIEDVRLGNATSGAHVTADPVKLNGSYKYLRFYLLESTRGYIFGHFAEFHLFITNAGKFNLLTNSKQLSSNASDAQEGKDLNALIDNDINTFWHSDWHNKVKDTHYLQVQLNSPIEGDLVIDVTRRLTPDDHVTLLGVHGSLNGTTWKHISDVKLDNATSGKQFVTGPIPMDDGYKYLKFYILKSTRGNIFGHFAEFHLTEVCEPGENYIMDMPNEAEALLQQLQKGAATADADLTPEMLVALQEAYDAFVARMEQLKDAPDILTSLSQLQQSVTYSIHNANDEGYIVFNPDITDKWVSVLGAKNETYQAIANEAYRQKPDLRDPKNLWQFIFHEGEWYLYNQGAQRFLYTDGASAYQFSPTPTPVHLTQIDKGVFAINTADNDPQSQNFASVNLSKETKPLQRSVKEDHGAQFVLKKESQPIVEVDIAGMLYQMRLPKSLAQLTDLPTLYINTFDGHSISSKHTYKYANMWRVSQDGIERFDSLEIRGRGNSTWEMAKKPYRIKFKEKEKFLGKERANARNWTLMANYADKTLLRNAVASFIGTQMGQVFTPAASFADLYINDKFLGNYQISDHVQIKKKRIDITEQEEIPTQDSDITGGYFLEVIGSSVSEPVYIRTDRGTNITVKSPEEEVITSRQKTYIRDFVSEFENRLMGSSYKNPTKGYRPMVDSLAVASWFLTTEFTGNADGYYSVYFYKEAQDDHLYFGPIWDFDIAFNNCDRIGVVDKRMMIDAGFIGCKWPGRMWQDPWFRNMVGRIWHERVRDGLVKNTLAYVDSMAVVIDQSQKKNFSIWPLSSHVYNEITLWSTFQEGVDYLKWFITEHADYLSSIMPDPEQNPSSGNEDDGLGIKDSHYYHIYNAGNKMAVDVADNGTTVCIWTPSQDRQDTQQWYLKKATDGYYQILSRESNLAITDMAKAAGSGYAIGSAISLTEADPDDDRQLWRPVRTGDYLVFENLGTDLIWNNSGSGRNDGNKILSWTNNADNASKPTRLWYIEEADERLVNTIETMPDDLDYRITYDPAAQKVNIRIPATMSEIPNTRIALFDLEGRQLMEGSFEDPLDVSALPHAVYVLRWTVGPSTRSMKFMKR